jgi:hypothetical protein
VIVPALLIIVARSVEEPHRSGVRPERADSSAVSHVWAERRVDLAPDPTVPPSDT